MDAAAIKWIRMDVAQSIQHEQIQEHGGYPGVVDKNLLESALERPKNFLAYGNQEKLSVPILAAYYAIGIIKNHPFKDGNKRTALVVTILFLFQNGYHLDATDSELVDIFYKLAGGLISEDKFKKFIFKKCVVIEPGQEIPF